MVVASSKEIPCFLTFERALEASHSKSRLMNLDYHERDHAALENLTRAIPNDLLRLNRTQFIRSFGIHPCRKQGSNPLVR